MKYSFILFLISTLLLSCNQPKKKKTVKNNIEKITKKDSDKDTLIYSVSTKIQNEKYTADYRSNMVLYIIRKNDTLITQKQEGLSPIPLKFEDFNHDGFLDIRYGYNSNYFYEMIMLFDFQTKQFKKIEDIDTPEYANSSIVKKTNLYYSFSPNECGKNNWESYLFSIKNYKVETKGLIQYKQCEDDEKGMYVFKIDNDKEIFIEKISLKEADKMQLENHWIKYLKKITSL